MTRVAAIDCGTNSIRLLVADVDPATGRLRDLDRRMEIVRLGQRVDRTGMLAADALERTFAAARRYGQLLEELGVERTRFVATSATRDASNREVFVAGIRDILGVEPEVVSGVEEAELSFRGATSALGGAHPGPFLVVDIGGGSTEVVLGTNGVEAARSADVGCVRITERRLTDDPPTTAQVAAATADIGAALDEVAAHVPLARTATLVGLAGSVTTVTAHALRLASYERDRINGVALDVDTVLAAARELLEMPREQRAALGFMHPGRVDVIGAGALVWSLVVQRVRDEVAAVGGRLRSVVTSEHDILDGIALSAAG